MISLRERADLPQDGGDEFLFRRRSYAPPFALGGQLSHSDAGGSARRAASHPHDADDAADRGRRDLPRALPQIVDAVERPEASVAELNGVSAHGVLRVTAPLGLGRRVIAPMMARFREAQPHTDVRLRLSDICSTWCAKASTSRSVSRRCRTKLHPAQSCRCAARPLFGARLSRPARRA